MMYAVINEKLRDAFEKRYQMPYGYGNAIKVTSNYDEALEWLRACSDKFVIERYSPDCGRDIIYRN